MKEITGCGGRGRLSDGNRERAQELNTFFNLCQPAVGSSPTRLQHELLWNTACLVPVPKKSSPSGLSDYRPVTLKSHVMKVMDRLVLAHLRPRVKTSLYPLQFAPQGTVLSPFLFTLYTTDFQCNSES